MMETNRNSTKVADLLLQTENYPKNRYSLTLNGFGVLRNSKEVLGVFLKKKKIAHELACVSL